MLPFNCCSMLPVFGSKSNRGATGTTGRSVQERPSLHRAEMFNNCVGLFKGKLVLVLWYWSWWSWATSEWKYVISLQYFDIFHLPILKLISLISSINIEFWAVFWPVIHARVKGWYFVQLFTSGQNLVHVWDSTETQLVNLILIKIATPWTLN